MCGWLPFHPKYLTTSHLDLMNSARYVSKLSTLSDPQVFLPFTKTPFWLGHGKNDQAVHIKLGNMAKDELKTLGLEVGWKEYELDHEFKSPEQIDDMVGFIKRNL